MFGLKLSLPEYVNMSLEPHPEDQSLQVLKIEAKSTQDAQPFTLSKNIPRNIGAVQFGKDLMAAINYLYQQIHG